MGLVSFSRTLAVGTIAALATASFGSPDLQMGVIPAIPGLTEAGSHYPLVITAQNSGADARGEIQIVAAGITTHYPIDLPARSKKSIMAYPAADQYGRPMHISLTTDRGNIDLEWTPSPVDPGEQILDITDTGGGLGFIRAKQYATSSGSNSDPRMSGVSSGYRDVYVKPELAPDRAAAYFPLRAIVLGAGAARMSDASVSALQKYALMGGTVLILGGAAPEIARDPRWLPLLPIRSADTKTVASLAFTIDGNTFKIPGPATIATGTPAEGSQLLSSGSDQQMLLMKPFGEGRILYFAANLFEQPVVGYDSRAELVGRILRLYHPTLSAMIVVQTAHSLANTQGYQYPPIPPNAGGSSGFSQPSPLANNPFSVSLPPTSVIFEILFAYFILVVPVNLLVLKKFGRGELAWITAPLISLAFAGTFFKFAGNLYSASLSKQTTGLVVADSNSSLSYFAGDSQMFFPKGGNYDLKIQNAEFVDDSELGFQDPYSRSRGAGIGTQLNPVDVGHVLVPSMNTTNLSFQEISIGQALDPGLIVAPSTHARSNNGSPWIRGTVQRDGDHLSGRITNESRIKIVDCQLTCRDGRAPIGNLGPGESKVIDTQIQKASPSVAQQSIYWLARGRVLFIGTLIGYDPGVQIGVTPPGMNGISLVENMGPEQLR